MAHYRIIIKNSGEAVKHLVLLSVPLNKVQVESLCLGIAMSVLQPNKKLLIEAQDMETGEIVFNVMNRM